MGLNIVSNNVARARGKYPSRPSIANFETLAAYEQHLPDIQDLGNNSSNTFLTASKPYFMVVDTQSEESPLLGDANSSGLLCRNGVPQLWMIPRVGAAMYSFAFLGLFTATIGVMLQPLIHHYSLSDVQVSLVFIVGPAGYIMAAQLNNQVHWKLGQRGMAVLAPTCHTIGVLIIATHPPFPIVLLGFAIGAFGSGFLDGSLCAWAATVHNANTVTGMMQGSFSVGAALGPFLAGKVLPAWNGHWYDWYYVLAIASILELCLLFLVFRNETADKYRGQAQDEETLSRHIFHHRATWLVAVYLLAYCGIETAISGWMVTFMIRSRNATPHFASISSTVFWGGMAAGRFTLGIVTDKLGVGRANIVYFVITLAVQVVFAFVRNDVACIILLGSIGFFMGPMFACGIVQVTRLLPRELHVAAISFGASAGQFGAALLPFGIGACIQAMGINMFPVAIVSLSFLTFLSWLPLL
ncbi:uncharacterized protein RSE6_14743 [Rhynchosporium secalis]|uniref:Major facilitator superfamily (MFS) profile domain-containing protein n=1 Tax=Rhynchosporium secalis TaxID=38038 RepID=A0A1E1MW22_RHYSE|nr:uncharacterized protein RSE6_14743 [Rhynchosporium secalis]